MNCNQREVNEKSLNCNIITLLQLEVFYKHINLSLYDSTDNSRWAMDMVCELSGLFSPIPSTLEHRPSCRIFAPLYRRRVLHLLLHTFHRQLQNTCTWLTHTATTSFFKKYTNKHNWLHYIYFSWQTNQCVNWTWNASHLAYERQKLFPRIESKLAPFSNMDM